MLAARLAKTGEATAPGADLRKRAPTFGKGWDFGAGALDGLIADIRSDGVGLLVLVFPYRFQLAGNEAQTDARLSLFLSERGVEFLDFIGPFRQEARNLYQRGDEIHFNAEGHRYIAESVAVRLKRVAAAGASGMQDDQRAD